MRRFALIICLLAVGVAPGAAQPNGVTTYAQMTAQLKSEAAQSPNLKLVSLGKSAGGRRDLWLVRVADPNSDPNDALRVLVLCRQHGDEPASTEAVLRLIHQAVALPHVALYLVPMVNPDGAEAGTRGNKAGADLNRDWGVFSQPETQAVARAERLIRPHIVIDAHNWDTTDSYNADCIEVAREQQTPLGRLDHQVQLDAIKQLAATGYLVHPTGYGAEADPHLAHRYFASQHVLSLLVETHSGSPNNTADFQRRQGMYLALIHALLLHFSHNSEAERQNLNTLEGDSSGGYPTLESRLILQNAPTAAPRMVAGMIPAMSFPLWLWPLCLFALALWFGMAGENAKAAAPFGFVVKPGYYSSKRKRSGTDTKVRSGQRKAVSSPPR